MKPRFYVQQGINTWLVLDRLKIKLHNDKIAVLPTRKEARERARELNNEERQDRNVDGQTALDGETI